MRRVWWSCEEGEASLSPGSLGRSTLLSRARLASCPAVPHRSETRLQFLTVAASGVLHGFYFGFEFQLKRWRLYSCSHGPIHHASFFLGRIRRLDSANPEYIRKRRTPPQVNVRKIHQICP